MASPVGVDFPRTMMVRVVRVGMRMYERSAQARTLKGEHERQRDYLPHVGPLFVTSPAGVKDPQPIASSLDAASTAVRQAAVQHLPHFSEQALGVERLAQEGKAADVIGVAGHEQDFQVGTMAGKASH